MNFVIKGNLRGFLCRECTESISDATVLLYRTQSDVNITAAAVADSKETFRVVRAQERERRKPLLLAEAKTDAEGNFEIQLADDQGGQAFDIDFYCGTVPRGPRPPKGPPDVQFHITTVFPRWRQQGLEQRNDNYVYDWKYIVSPKWWCFIRGYYFDAWVICGRLRDCQSGAALPGVTVRAMDVDFFTDDLLGADVTDASGHFRIDYASADFKRTFLSPLINVETDVTTPFSAGPDVYFQLEFGGTPVAFETPSDKRTNVGYCLCVDLCVRDIVIPDPVVPASFTHIGRSARFHIQSDINSATGKTQRPGADNYAFFSSLVLIGSLSKKLNGQPMEYRFEFQEVATPASPISPGAWQPVTPGMIGKTNIGYIWSFTGDPMNPVETEPYFINGNPATENTVTFNGNWIQMPQDANFAPHVDADILVLNTEALMPVAAIDVAGMAIGNATIPGVAPRVANRYFALRMKQREQSINPTIPAGQVAGTSKVIAVFNARYHNVKKHGSWVPTSVSNQFAVASLDIQEIAEDGGGCGKITNSLQVKYNARNENLGGVSLSITGPTKPGQSFSFPPIAAAQPEVFGTTSLIISPVNDVSDMLPCAYTVFLSASVLLTTGDGGVDPVQDFVSFCKVS